MPVRPTSDVSTTGWTPSTGASAYATLDEVAPDDGDYVSSQASGVSPLVLGLGATLPAGTHRVAVRMRRSAGSQDMIVRLLDGAGAVQGASAAQAVSTLGTYIFPVTTSGAAVRWELRESAGAQTLVQAGRFDNAAAYYAHVVSGGSPPASTSPTPDQPTFLRTSGSLVGQITVEFSKPNYLGDGSLISTNPVTSTYLYRFASEASAVLGSAGSPSQTVNCGAASTGTFSGVAPGTYWVSAECANTVGQSYPSHPIEVVVT